MGCSRKRARGRSTGERSRRKRALLHVSTLRAVTSGLAGSIIRYATSGDKEPQCSRYWHFCELLRVFLSLSHPFVGNFYRLSSSRKRRWSVIFFIGRRLWRGCNATVAILVTAYRARSATVGSRTTQYSILPFFFLIKSIYDRQHDHFCVIIYDVRVI